MNKDVVLNTDSADGGVRAGPAFLLRIRPSGLLGLNTFTNARPKLLRWVGKADCGLKRNTALKSKARAGSA